LAVKLKTEAEHYNITW